MNSRSDSLPGMDTHKMSKLIGQMIRVSDGTPKPPERFKRKLASWHHKNFIGKLTEIKPSREGTAFHGAVLVYRSKSFIFTKWVTIKNISALDTIKETNPC